MEVEALIRSKFVALKGSMDERVTRLWAGAEAEALGRGGIAAVARATGLAISTVTKGRNELRTGAKPDDLVRVRRKGGGGRMHEDVHPELVPSLKKLVDPATRGDPESALRWSAKSAVTLSREMLDAHGIPVSDKTVGRLLHQLGFSLQAAKKTVEGSQHPDRNAQFEYINAQAEQCLERGAPFISVDTKKKELVGNFKNAGVEWQPTDSPELVDVHDFPTLAIGKAIPYGVYDVADNSGFVNVGTDHDTPVFAVTSIEAWWRRMGSQRYPNAAELFITADAGGSNGHRPRVWKFELQRLADKLGLPIHVSHFPPGTSKWNKVEHRLFSFITMNWRGKPLRTYETVVNLIGHTTNSAGLVVKATLDRRRYPTGKKISAK
ncbi:ISAzo13 family transposase, partial [Brevundimonas sp.]|uniref:ISAzo13 family transposase n=1 Tax=Brevundimonas sp. TaxID=1871086 RepID=UPI003522905F